MPASHNPFSDEELMIAYTCGNAAAFDTLYTRHESAMLRFIRRVLGTALNAQAEEVFQDVWMRIIAAKDRYAPPEQSGASWKTWAYAIAHHACIDRLRSQKKYILIEKDTDEYDPMEWIQTTLGMTHRSSEDEAFWKAAGAKLLECVEDLPDTQRAAFLLHHDGEQNSIEELAQALSMPFETVKSRLRYAMQKLRNCMRHYLDELGRAP